MASGYDTASTVYRSLFAGGGGDEQVGWCKLNPVCLVSKA